MILTWPSNLGTAPVQTHEKRMVFCSLSNTIQSTWNLLFSVRDQGVGGLNPLSPTIYLQADAAFSGIAKNPGVDDFVVGQILSEQQVDSRTCHLMCFRAGESNQKPSSPTTEARVRCRGIPHGGWPRSQFGRQSRVPHVSSAPAEDVGL